MGITHFFASPSTLPLTSLLPFFFAYARFLFLLRVQFFFKKKIRQIDSYLYLMYDVCAIYSWTKTNRQPYKTILLNWWNCIVYFIHNSVHLNSIPWSNPKIRCYSDFFLCVFAAHGYNNLRKCTNGLFNIERSRKC